MSIAVIMQMGNTKVSLKNSSRGAFTDADRYSILHRAHAPRTSADQTRRSDRGCNLPSVRRTRTAAH
jgi:hypothetical protein